MVRELWRLRCPEGHASWRARQATSKSSREEPAFECRSCAVHYEFLVDAKTGRKEYA